MHKCSAHVVAGCLGDVFSDPNNENPDKRSGMSGVRGPDGNRSMKNSRFVRKR